VSRGGLKLDHALRTWTLDVSGLICADLGCSTGGFTDCLLRRGAGRVYAVDTGYGVLDWSLRRDPRVVVRERTNAMHVVLPEPVNLTAIDAGWTRQRHILPSAARLLRPDGCVVSLLKPHYEAGPRLLRKGILPTDALPGVVERVRIDVADAGFEWIADTPSPIAGSKGNAEVLILLRPRPPVSPASTQGH
jgi:23S rRNA (cytidine1920-2'-O)/16S rRNA (cytidine1409-2'-O)-methyltransferase